MHNLTNILKDIVEIPSPTGFHRDIVKYLYKFLDENKLKYTTQNKGSIIVEIPGESKDAILFSAHVDTLGAMVKEVKGNGRLKLALMGGSTWVTLDAENCTVRNSKDVRYSGTIQGVKPSVHIDGAEAHKGERTQETVELILDEKVSSKEDVLKLGINVGDFVFIDPKFVATESGFIKSRYLDDKASVAILLEAMKQLKDQKLKNTIYFFISVYEEIGHGATSGIEDSVKEFIAVDMGAPGNGQNSTEFHVNICAKDSSGPYDLDLKERLVELCEEKNIPYVVDIYNFYGSDASAALRSGHDLRTGLIGAGVFASHGYERTHIDSMEATLNLVLEYAKLGLK